MAYSPLPGPELPALPTPPVLPLLESAASTEIAAAPDTEVIFHALRQLIAAGTRDLDVILGEIAKAAQSLTGSSGAAIAVRRGGVVICLGRSGDTAPALGTRLSVDSGISGECFRTGKTLRCDDASKDYRADQEVCRQLGLRSVAAVPLRQRGHAVGILEAFSTQPHAFAEDHMDLLTQLARLAEVAAFESAREVEAAPASARPAELASAGALTRLRGRIAPRPANAAQHERRQRYRVAGVALAMLLLFSVVSWRMRRNSAISARGPQQPAPATTLQPTTAQLTTKTEALDASFGAAASGKPSPAHSRSESKAGSALHIVPRATGTEAAQVASPRNDAPDVGDRFTAPVSAADTAELVSLLSAPATLPDFGARVSQGFSGGVLVRKVRPIYPPQAIPLRLEGSVLLQALVTENGAVRDLKAMSGHPLLVRAAIAAVSQWRYRPFLLNGKPIQKQVDISIDFKNPQGGK